MSTTFPSANCRNKRPSVRLTANSPGANVSLAGTENVVLLRLSCMIDVLAVINTLLHQFWEVQY